jgi:hypothetical protein
MTGDLLDEPSHAFLSPLQASCVLRSTPQAATVRITAWPLVTGKSKECPVLVAIL